MTPDEAMQKLKSVTARHGDLAVAVSGGVDSLTLAAALGRLRPGLDVVHSASPAVPGHATARVKEIAAAEGWRLQVLDTGEFSDPDYLRNPVNRCYFCKSNLYNRMRQATDATLASGTNTDDLADYRPGLTAAAEQGVVHPFVEAGISKVDLRALARWLGMGDVAELPAQPCLSSRIETGLPILADDLAFVAHVENWLRATMPQATNLRCRITRQGARIECDVPVDPALRAFVEDLCATQGRVLAGIVPYRRGSAFLQSHGAA